MIDRTAARALASREVPNGLRLDEARLQELRDGWFFPYRTTDPDPDPLTRPLICVSRGVIVNKQTGARFQLFNWRFPIARDLALYDKGYQFHSYALVVTEIADMKRTLDTLLGLDILVVEPTYEHGEVWRIARSATRDELQSAVERLPHVFDRVNLNPRAEVLEEARQGGFFQFRLLGCA